MIASQSRNFRIIFILGCLVVIAGWYRLFPSSPYHFPISGYGHESPQGVGTPEEIAEAKAALEGTSESDLAPEIPKPIRVTKVVELKRPTTIPKAKEAAQENSPGPSAASYNQAKNPLGSIGERLPHATQYAARFPRKIWQFWKSPFDTLGEDDHREVQTWRELNPEYRWELIVNGGAEITYVQDRYADRPDIVDTFVSLRDFMYRVDLLRYLVLYSEGGTYADIDTRCLRPISKWIGPAWEGRPINLVLGIEIDSPDGPKWKEWADTFQFAVWSVMAKPGHPILERAITRVSENVKKMNDAGEGVQLSGAKVLTLGGPAAFTKAALEAMSEMTGTNVTYKNMTGLTEPKIIGDVLILPITAFGPDQSHSNSKPSTDEAALVKHLFKGTWKAAHPWDEDMKETAPATTTTAAAGEVDEVDDLGFEDEDDVEIETPPSHLPAYAGGKE